VSSGPFLFSTSRPPRRGRRALIAFGVVVGVLALAAGVIGVVALLERGTVPVGTAVGGLDVGGKSLEDARAAIEAAAAERIRRPIRLIAPGGEQRITGAELKAEPLVDAALDEALDVGLLDRALRHVDIGSKAIELDYGLRPVRAAQVANRIDREFGEPPRDAAVIVSADTVKVEPAATGIAVDRGALRRALRALPAEVGVPLEQAAPVVSTKEAMAAAARVERLVEVARAVRFRDVQATLFPSRLRALVRTERNDGTLHVTLDPKGLLASLRPRLRGFEQQPRDADFSTRGTRATVIPSRPGKALDAERISASLANNLASTVHRARFAVEQPTLTTEDAKKLGIRELISEFTTYYPCCPGRVTNIKRGAEIMDGTIVRPGMRFSLNQVLGKRTAERGFVSAPQILAGRLEDAIGGGVSQIATTTFNAAFFAGVQIVAHQPHEFYISRYPMGREATVSWGGPELIWRNDWPAAILVKAVATDSSITVGFYSTKLGRRVETSTGEPSGYTSPTTRIVSNPSLPPGTRTVVQSAGPSGFLVSYTRKVFRDGELRRKERYVWRYRPENAIIEVGPPKSKAMPKHDPKPKPDPGESPEDVAPPTNKPAPRKT
jgi:vancomycin resistance protein YoaR